MKKFTLVVAVLLVLLAPYVWLQYPVKAQVVGDTTAKAVVNKASAQEVKVFQLLNADAKSLTQTLQPIFRSSPELQVITVFDERTNTIIARGPDAELQILEVLLKRLDEPTDGDKVQ
jgi:type II secretory pathway component GspD/PulD (secretin)